MIMPATSINKKRIRSPEARVKRRQQEAVWRADNREKIREYHAKWRADNADKCEVYYRKNKGLPDPTRPRPLVCEICEKLPVYRRKLDLDHCHTTGQFRGWLCLACNPGIGMFQNSPELLRKAADYLEKNKQT